LHLSKVIGKHKTVIGALGLTALLLPVIIYGLIFPETFPDQPVSAYISGTPDTVVPGTPASVDLGVSQPIPSRVNLDIVMCIDVSGSMDDPIPGEVPGVTDPSKLDAAKYAMEILLNTSEEGDRIGIVKYSWNQFGTGSPRWWFDDDAINVTSGLLYQNDTTLLQEIRNLGASGWTDIYAGLNESLEMSLEADIRANTLRVIILLTDGAHNHGPYGIYGNTSLTWNSSRDPFGNLIPASWTVDDYNGGSGPGGAHNYTGFLTYENTTYNILSPVLYAKRSGIPIYTIGFADASAGAIEYDPDFLGNISEATKARFFAAEDTFSLVNAFLKIRDQAAGWSNIQETDDIVSGDGFVDATWFDVTETTDKIKVVLNWNDTSADLGLILRRPDGNVIVPEENATSNMVYDVSGTPSYVVIELPMLGNWTFAVNATNITGDVRYFVMSSEFIPPLEISEITEPQVSEDQTEITFNITLTNTNANKTLENIQVSLNTTLNYMVSLEGFSLTPGQTADLMVNINTSIVLLKNVTINEFTVVEVRSGEGYFDAVGMKLSLSSEVPDKAIGGTLPGEEKGIIESLPNWYAAVIAAIAAGAILGLLAIYIKIKEIQFLNFLERFQETFGSRSRRIAETLAAMGAVGVSEREVRHALDESTSADEFKEKIEEKSGKPLSVEEFIVVSSGVEDLDRLRVQLEKVYGVTIPAEEFQDVVSSSKSLEDMRKKLEAVVGATITEEQFILIVSGEIMEVVEMQEMFAKLAKPEIPEVAMGPILSIEDIDIEGFRKKMRELFKP